jgi:hypothetical protein
VGDVDLSDEIDTLRERDVEAIIFHGTDRSFSILLKELRDQDALYLSTEDARTVTASKRTRRKRGRSWRPQIAAFDGVISPRSGSRNEIPAGTVAADTYARGAHYLPIPAFREFRENYIAWWDEEPLGWERRAYEATLMIGWAARRTEPGEDIAATLETLSGQRLGGLDVSFGPDDHTSDTQTTVGLWVVPRSGLDIREQSDLPGNMPWVMLARGFSTGGTRSDVLPEDWDYLFLGRYRPDGPSPRLTKARFGVATTRRDPVH